MRFDNMTDVQFEEEKSYTSGTKSPESNGLTKLMQTWGLAKNSRDSVIILLGTAIGAILLALALFFFVGKSPEPELPPPLPPGQI